MEKINVTLNVNEI